MQFIEIYCFISKIIVILTYDQIKKQISCNLTFSNDRINDDDCVFIFSLLCDDETLDVLVFLIDPNLTDNQKV